MLNPYESRLWSEGRSQALARDIVDTAEWLVSQGGQGRPIAEGLRSLQFLVRGLNIS